MCTQVCLISDLHGILPHALPACDILVIAGDLCPSRNHNVDFQRRWLRGEFTEWCAKQTAGKIIAIPGNHDWICQQEPDRSLYHIPEFWTLLIDESYEYRGIKFYGSPWSKRFMDWAFNMDEPQLAAKYGLIPGDVDVLIAHGPPYGAGDLVIGRPSEHLGSVELANYVAASKVKLLVCGHIHTGHGIYELHDTVVANASQLDECYNQAFRPIMATFEGNTLVNVKQL